ncbi:odorant receptor 49a isoform X2 [Solenopsis invicta]|uniref:odorant receptor 49a isoform X2 n=1 Tax=Solenopsis invicta TaxID=13686 RepID=UPI00193DFCB8|nr:odorant receptor 49a isoform X2 [Solenopsis invicta]
MFDDHYKFNETLLRFLGLWPFGRNECERCRAICFYILLISRVVAEFAQFIIADFSINVTIKILLDALTAFLYAVTFNMFFFNTEKLKQMLEEVNNNWRMLSDSQEIKILYYYSQQGEKFIIITILLQVLVLFIFFITGLLPDIFNFLRPLNESRTHYLLFMNEYRINVGIQYYLFFLYTIISVIIGTSTAIFIISTVLYINLHCCAMFKICSYRMKHCVDTKIIACSNKRNIIVGRIIKTVHIHQKANKLFKLVTTSFTMSFLTMLMIGTCSFAMCLYRLMNAITRMHDMVEILISAAYIIGYQFCFFTVSFMGQLVINHSDELFNAIYMSLWYETFITIQKSLLFIMHIWSKRIIINFGGVCAISMETFTSITNMSISFMMMFLSIQ